MNRGVLPKTGHHLGASRFPWQAPRAGVPTVLAWSSPGRSPVLARPSDGPPPVGRRSSDGRSTENPAFRSGKQAFMPQLTGFMPARGVVGGAFTALASNNGLFTQAPRIIIFLHALFYLLLYTFCLLSRHLKGTQEALRRYLIGKFWANAQHLEGNSDGISKGISQGFSDGLVRELVRELGRHCQFHHQNLGCKVYSYLKYRLYLRFS